MLFQLNQRTCLIYSIGNNIIKKLINSLLIFIFVKLNIMTEIVRLNR